MSLPAPYQLVPGTPSPAIYRRLRVAAGLSEKSAAAAALGLPNTLFAVTIQHPAATPDLPPETVGMGRVIGDGGLFFEVVDIAVHPAHQQRGLGKAIVGALVDHLHKVAPPTAHVTLIADGQAHRLYAQFGFQPVAPDSIGMAFHIR